MSLREGSRREEEGTLTMVGVEVEFDTQGTTPVRGGRNSITTECRSHDEEGAGSLRMQMASSSSLGSHPWVVEENPNDACAK